MSVILNASSRIMYEEAQRLGISCTTFGDKETILMEHQGKQWYVRGSRTSLQSSVGKTIADSKPLTKKVLEHFKLPTAKGVVVRSEADLALIKEFQYPVVMKPLDARHGAGVVVGLSDFERAAAAFRSLDTQQPMLFEETLQGTEYRVVCVDFQFVAAAFRKPAHVVGDGQRSVQSLIDEKNQHPWRGEGHENNLSLIRVDDMVTEFLAEQDLTVESVPSDGQEVKLRKTANLSTGGEAWDVSQEVCEENRALFAQIAKACDLNVIGIDVMCQSLAEPIIGQTHTGVIEVNASPGLRMHHFPIQGQPKNVAGEILSFVQRSL